MSNSTEGKILIATPSVKGFFRNSVIYIHTSDDTGAMGVVLNVPMDRDMATRWAKEIGWDHPDKIHLGGPVERQLGYIIHTNDYAAETSIHLNDYLSYTGGKGIVEDIQRGIGPSRFILVTGYCSWSPGQLEQEVAKGAWVVTDFDPDYFFQELDREGGWEFAVHVAAQNKTLQLLDMVDSI